jgi:hypothetical protein
LSGGQRRSGLYMAAGNMRDQGKQQRQPLPGALIHP